MLEILIITFVVLLAVGVWFAVLEPLFSTVHATENDKEKTAYLNVLEDLYARRDALYASIKELEFDHRVGKIDENDFQRFSARLKREAADVLRQIEEAKQTQAAIRERLETQIQSLIDNVPESLTSEGPIQAEKLKPSATTPRFCTQCGHRLQPGDRFCSQCGTPVREVVR